MNETLLLFSHASTLSVPSLPLAALFLVALWLSEQQKHCMGSWRQWQSKATHTHPVPFLHRVVLQSLDRL